MKKFLGCLFPALLLSLVWMAILSPLLYILYIVLIIFDWGRLICYIVPLAFLYVYVRVFIRFFTDDPGRRGRA